MKYKCKYCNKTHSCVYEAIICCNDSGQVYLYVCEVCKEQYESYNTANECCVDEKVLEVIE